MNSKPTIFYTTLCKYLEEKPDTLEEIKNQYLYLLSFLTTTSNLDADFFYQQVMNISITGDTVIGYTIDKETDKHMIVASGTIIYEPKLTHGGRNIGHIEDIVVHPEHRKEGIASTILSILSEFAKEKDCYKIILDCKPQLISVYRKSGFQNNGIQMSQYFI